MSFLVKPPIATTVKFSSSTGWNGRLSSVVVNVIHQLITIVSTVRQNLAAIYSDMLQQRDCVIDIITLPFTDHKIHRIPIGIYYCMDFGTGSSTAMSDFIWEPPFLAPALCW